MQTNIPHQLTNFIGRTRQLEEVKRMLLSNRLVTVTGSGGLGKTRLALQVAEIVQGHYPDGVRLVELAVLSDPRLLLQTVATTLNVREHPERTLEATVIEFLQPLSVLLVLDNCEHMVEACAQLVHSLLRSCPRLTVLATSRQALGVEGEACLLLPALALPAPSADISVESLSANEAVQLFVDRVRLRRRDFALSGSNAPSIAQLCYRLDGIPLAIELAAVRTKALSIDQILNRLDERFRLLASTSQTTVARHRTLEGMLDWSYELLTAGERSLFRALSVFSGGFNLDAVEQIVPFNLEELEQLVDKSLVQVDQSGHEARYSMIETIREYAEQRARQASKFEYFRERHLAWCVQLAEWTEDQLVSSRQALWLERLEQEHNNLRAALVYATSGALEATSEATVHMGLRLAGALVWFWYFRGYISEGRGWLEALLANVHTRNRDVSLAKALSAAGVMAYLQVDFAAAQARLEESLAIWRELEDKRGTAFALAFLGRTLAERSSGEGRAQSEESVELFRAIGDDWGLALALDFLGEQMLEAGETELAASLHNESLTLYREMGHHWGVALELTYFARQAAHQGEYAGARQRLEEAVKIQRAVGDRRMLGWTLANLGELVQREEGPEQATMLYREGLNLLREVGERAGMATILQRLGAISLAKGDVDAARQSSLESLALWRELVDQREIVRCLVQLRDIARAMEDNQGAEEYKKEATALAHALGDPSLVREAERPAPVPQPAPDGVAPKTEEIDDLTGREVEVLRLLAAGLTDAQIAEQLILSPRTVQAHIRTIYSKLNISTRSAATRYAMSKGLS